MTRAQRDMLRRQTKYAWVSVHELEPGTAYEAKLGQHFTCLPVSFAGQLYRIAGELGYKATVAIFPDKVIFSFYRPDAFMRPNLAAYPVVKKARRQA